MFEWTRLRLLLEKFIVILKNSEEIFAKYLKNNSEFTPTKSIKRFQLH